MIISKRAKEIMMIPIFSRVVILKKIKPTRSDGLLSIDSTERVEYENAGLMISGDYLIVTTYKDDSETNAKIYNLSEVEEYKTVKHCIDFSKVITTK